MKTIQVTVLESVRRKIEEEGISLQEFGDMIAKRVHENEHGDTSELVEADITVIDDYDFTGE